MTPWLRAVVRGVEPDLRPGATARASNTPAPADAQLPLHHPELFAAGWSVLIALVIAPLALRAFSRRTSE